VPSGPRSSRSSPGTIEGFFLDALPALAVFMADLRLRMAREPGALAYF